MKQTGLRRYRPSSSTARQYGFAILALLALAIVTRAAGLGHPDLHNDEAFYFAAGVEVSKGAIPFVDVWDRKPAGHFLLFAALAQISHAFVTYQIAALLFAAATAVVIYAIARRLVTHWPAVVGAAIYLLSLCLFNGQGGQSPVFYNLLIAGAAALLLKGADALPRRAGHHFIACAMLLAGIAITIKTTALFEAVYFGIYAAVLQLKMAETRAQSWRRLAIWVVIGAAPTLVFAAWYALHGYWEEYWTAMVLSNMRKSLASTGAVQRLTVIFTMLLPLFLASLAAMARLRGRDRVFFAGWIGAALSGFFSIPAGYLHYALPLLVPLCIIAPAGLRYARSVWFVLIWAAATPILFYPFFDFGATRTAATAMNRLEAAVRDGRDGGPVLIYDGPPLLYTLSGARFPSPLAFPEHLNMASERDVSHIRTLAETERLLAMRPSVIVDRKTIVTNRQTAQLVRTYERKNCTLLASEPMIEGWAVEVLVYGHCRHGQAD